MNILDILENNDRKFLNYKDVTKRIPELTTAAQKLKTANCLIQNTKI